MDRIHLCLGGASPESTSSFNEPEMSNILKILTQYRLIDNPELYLTATDAYGDLKSSRQGKTAT